MEVGKFNLYQVKIYLEIHTEKEEKLKYLYGLKKDLRKIILSFENSNMVPLRTYADCPELIDDSSYELRTFLKEVILKYSFNPNDNRSPSENFLRRMVESEIVNYKRFEQLVDVELESVMSDSESFVS